MDDRARVAAIRDGNPAGLASAYDAYGGGLYSFCLAMLHERARAEDAVQDTFVVLAERVGQLRDPERLRPWLYAVARTQCLRQIRAARRAVPVDEWDDAVTGESVDFEGNVHSAQLQALVWQAMGGLNAGERAALELSLRHGLAGDDLAAALDVSRGTANKLLERGRAELERSLGALLVARDNASRCASLASVVAGWDGTMTVLMRKRIGRHIDKCSECGEEKKHRVSAVALLATIPLLAAPAALRHAVIGKFRLVSDDTALNSITRFDAAGFPTERVQRRRVRGALLVAAVAAVLASVLVTMHVAGTRHHLRPAGALADTSTSLSTSVPAPSSSSSPATVAAATTRRHVARPPRPRRESSAARTTLPVLPPPITSPTPSLTARSVPPPTRPVTTHPVTTHPATTAATSARPPSSSSPPPSSPAPAPAPKVSAAVNPVTYPASDGGSGVLTLTVSGAPITWTATATNGVTLSPSSGTVPAGGTRHAKVNVPPSKPGAISLITITWAHGQRTLKISWK